MWILLNPADNTVEVENVALTSCSSVLLRCGSFSRLGPDVVYQLHWTRNGHQISGVSGVCLLVVINFGVYSNYESRLLKGVKSNHHLYHIPLHSTVAMVMWLRDLIATHILYVQGKQILTNGDLVVSNHGNGTNALYNCLLRTAHGSNLTVASYNITTEQGKISPCIACTNL